MMLSILVLSISSCFKDVPSSEFSEVAGSWKIESVVIEMYDTLGNSIEQKTFNDRGYLLLNYNDGSLAENTFGYSISTDNDDFNSSSAIAYVLGLCDRWDVAVNAGHINFGYIDQNTGFTTQLVALSIIKLNSNHMHWASIDRNLNGSIARKEVYKLKRSN